VYVIACIELHSYHKVAGYDIANGLDDLVEKAEWFAIFVSSKVSLKGRFSPKPAAEEGGVLSTFRETNWEIKSEGK
jgi:hypothetical protein